MLILQFFGGLVVSLLASIGVLQTPGPEGLVFPAHLRCTGLLEIGVFQTPCLIDMIAGMGCTVWRE